jgi:hypothetical protein
MTNEIAHILQDKAGLSEENSQQVAQIILDHIKSKIPPQYAAFVNPILGGESAPGESEGGLGGLMGAASGLFGGHNS